MSDSNSIKLNNGVNIPQIGLGVWKVKNGQQAIDTVGYAIKTGYRLIDTAAFYNNEASVGRAIAISSIPRKQLFVTTKLWNSDQGYESALTAFNKSLNLLGLDYLDLYLIHWPSHDLDLIVETWQTFEEIYRSKKVRAIGVSNFKPDHLSHLLKHSRIAPAINQIELHPYNAQLETRAYCKNHNIAVESWSPLMQGGRVLDDPLVLELSKKYHKSPAQIVLRWHIQNNLVVIPKSVTPSRIKENFENFDYELSNQDLKKLNSLDRGARVGPDPDGLAIRFYTSLSRGVKSLKKPKH